MNNKPRLETICIILHILPSLIFLPGMLLNRVLYAKAPPRGPIPYPFLNHFLNRQVTPFLYLLLTNGNPLIYLV